MKTHLLVEVDMAAAMELEFLMRHDFNQFRQRLSDYTEIDADWLLSFLPNSRTSFIAPGGMHRMEAEHTHIPVDHFIWIFYGDDLGWGVHLDRELDATTV